MNGPSMRGMIFDGTLRNWPTSTGKIFDGRGIGPDSKLKVFPFQNDEYDSKGTEKIHFKSPGVYSDGKTTFSNYIMNEDGTSGRFNSEFTFDSVTSDGHFSMYQNSKPYNTPPPGYSGSSGSSGSPISLNYFTLDPDLSISSIVIGNITTYTWIPPSSSSSPYSSIPQVSSVPPQVSSGPWDDGPWDEGPSNYAVSSGSSNYAGSSNPIVSNIITT